MQNNPKTQKLEKINVRLLELEQEKDNLLEQKINLFVFELYTETKAIHQCPDDL